MLSPLDFHSVLLLSSCFFTSCEPSKADHIRTCGTHLPKPICLVCRFHRWFRLSNISKVGSTPINNPIVYSLIYSSKKYKLSFSSSFYVFIELWPSSQLPWQSIWQTLVCVFCLTTSIRFFSEKIIIIKNYLRASLFLNLSSRGFKQK